MKRKIMKRRKTMSSPSEEIFSFSVSVHVVVVRRRLGCGASSRQAVIGWNVHK